MSNDFNLLCNFLDQLQEEVEGHSVAELPADLDTQLEAFARGRLQGGARDAIVALALSDNRVMEMLAAAVD